MQNHYEEHQSKKQRDPNSIHYYKQKLQKGTLLVKQQDNICGQMILDHLRDLGCEFQLFEGVRTLLTNKSGVHCPNGDRRFIDIDISLKQIVQNQYGTSQEHHLQNAMKRYGKQTVERCDRLSRVESVSRRAQQVLCLNGARRERIQGRLPIRDFRRLKTCFGHALHPDNQDQEDPYIPVYNVIYDRTGQLLLTGDDMGLIKIWSSSNGLLLQSLKGHTMAINSMDISNCNKYLASCSNDGLVLFWEIQTGKPIAALKESQDDPILVLLFFKKDEIHNYLAVASEKGCVYIYDLEEIIKCDGGMLGTQFNQKMKRSSITHETEILRLQVTSRPQYIKEKMVKNRINGILCMEFNREGYLVMGTEQGDVIVWDSPEKLDQSQLRKVEWHEHQADCHLAKWNRQGDKLMTASFDGTSRLWNWNDGGLNANEFNKSSVVLKYRQNDNKRIGEINCLALAWSCHGTYALSSFSRKFKRRGDEEKAKTQIQVYSYQSNSVINCLDSEYFNDTLKMEVAVFILEAHPFYEEIAMSADQNGLIIIWDIFKGEAIKIFHERGYHMKLPNLEVPLLDGCFSPNGLTFVVSTDFGSFSIYGFGVGEIYEQTPVEQFYVSDSIHPIIDDSNGFKILALDSDMEFCYVDRGSICNFYRMPYQYNIFNNFRLFCQTILNSDGQGKRSVNIQKPKILSYLQTSKGIAQNNKNNEDMFMNSFMELQQMEDSLADQLDQVYQQKSSEKQRKVDSDIERMFEIKKQAPQSARPSRTIQSDDEHYQVKSDGSSKQSHGKLIRKQESKEEEQFRCSAIKNEDDSQFFNISDQFKEMDVKRNTRKRKLIESDNEDEAQAVRQDQPSSGRATRQRIQQRDFQSTQNRLNTLNTHRQLRNQDQRRSRSMIQEMCMRCKASINEQSIKCQDCKQSYHKECADIRLFASEQDQVNQNKRYCINCLGQHYKKKQPNKSINNTALRDEYLKDDPSMPQIGDAVIFFTRGYEQYIHKNIYQLDLGQLSMQNNQYIVFPGDILQGVEDSNYLYCTLMSIQYVFPISHQIYKNKKDNNQQYQIIQVLELQSQHSDFTFNCFYSFGNEQFIVLEKSYTHAIKSIKTQLYPNILIQTDQDQENEIPHQYILVNFEQQDKYLDQSDWQTLKCRKIQDDNYQLRNSKNQHNQLQFYYINMWEVASIMNKVGTKDAKSQEMNGVQLQSVLTELESKNIVKEIMLMLKKNQGIQFYFFNPVDHTEYAEYNSYVPLGSSISLIKRRLEDYYYRSKEQLINDVLRIKNNAYLFNPPDSEVCKLADQLFNHIQSIANHQQEIEKVSPKVYEIQTRHKKRQ